MHGGVHDRASSKCTEGDEGQLLPSCIRLGVSTSGARPMSLNSLEAGVEAPSARTLSVSPPIDGVSARSTHLLEEAATSEDLSAFLILNEADCLLGVSNFCAHETAFLIWHDPRG